MESDLWGALIRILVCLPVVVILAYGFIKFGMAKNHPGRKGNLEIIEQIALQPKATLSVVRVGDEYLLISATEKEIVFIKPLDDYQENESSEFQFHLTDAIKRISKGSRPA